LTTRRDAGETKVDRVTNALIEQAVPHIRRLLLRWLNGSDCAKRREALSTSNQDPPIIR